MFLNFEDELPWQWSNYEKKTSLNHILVSLCSPQKSFTLSCHQEKERRQHLSFSFSQLLRSCDSLGEALLLSLSDDVPQWQCCERICSLSLSLSLN